MRIAVFISLFFLFAGFAFGADLFDAKFPATVTAMTPFNLEIKALSAPSPKKIKVSFEMKAMYMGEFKFEAEEKNGSYLIEKVTLPRCMSGDKNWILIIDYGGGKQEINFEVN
jgi:hypothetical protein